jgi:CBS domain containing-hemolysin-like protein
MKYSFSNSIRWSVFIFFVTFTLAAVFSIVSTSVLEGVSWGIGMLIVFLLICTGIFFDMVGIASTAATEIPFHGMAAERVKGSKQAISIIRNADRFSNICNDVIGDISGIVSGAASALVVIKLISNLHLNSDGLLAFVTSIVFAATVSGLTVGGKALGKSFAIHQANRIILGIGRAFYVLESTLKIQLLNNKKKNSNGKRGSKSGTRNHSSAK